MHSNKKLCWSKKIAVEKSAAIFLKKYLTFAIAYIIFMPWHKSEVKI